MLSSIATHSHICTDQCTIHIQRFVKAPVSSDDAYPILNRFQDSTWKNRNWRFSGRFDPPNVIQIPVKPSWQKLCSGYRPWRKWRMFCGFMDPQEPENQLSLKPLHGLRRCARKWGSWLPAFSSLGHLIYTIYKEIRNEDHLLFKRGPGNVCSVEA